MKENFGPVELLLITAAILAACYLLAILTENKSQNKRRNR
jgi:hypothetical protein